jgi:uncharacterized protein (DUF1778 family)
MPAATIPPQRYPDDNSVVLSDRDFDAVIKLMRNPPKPNAALKRAFKLLRANNEATKADHDSKFS